MPEPQHLVVVGGPEPDLQADLELLGLVARGIARRYRVDSPRDLYRTMHTLGLDPDMIESLNWRSDTQRGPTNRGRQGDREVIDFPCWVYHVQVADSRTLARPSAA